VAEEYFSEWDQDSRTCLLTAGRQVQKLSSLPDQHNLGLLADKINLEYGLHNSTFAPKSTSKSI